VDNVNIISPNKTASALENRRIDDATLCGKREAAMSFNVFSEIR